MQPLALTADQRTKLKPIFDAAQAQAVADTKRAEQDSKPTGDQILNQMVIRETDFRTRLSTVLTPDQLARYVALTEAHAPRVRTLVPHPAHGHGAMEHSTPGATPAKEPPPGTR